MAYQSTGGYGLPFPVWPVGSASLPNAPNNTTYILDASGEKAAVIYEAQAAKVIRKIHVRLGSVTTGDTVDIRVETVSTGDGHPTGTLWATNTNASLVVGSSDDDTWKSVTLTADATIAAGDIYAIVLVNGAGGGNMRLTLWNDQLMAFPYGDLFAAAAWSKQQAVPMFVPEYDDGSFGPQNIVEQGAPVSTQTFNSGSATNRRGNRFTLPFPTRALGCWVWVDHDGDFTVKLYDSDGTTVLATTGEARATQAAIATGQIELRFFDSPQELAKDTVYRLAVVPSTVTNLSTYDFDVPAAGMLDCFTGGQACHASVYTSGSWVETTTRRALMGLMLNGFSDGVGSGLLTHPGMSGGMRG